MSKEERWLLLRADKHQERFGDNNKGAETVWDIVKENDRSNLMLDIIIKTPGSYQDYVWQIRHDNIVVCTIGKFDFETKIHRQIEVKAQAMDMILQALEKVTL